MWIHNVDIETFDLHGLIWSEDIVSLLHYCQNVYLFRDPYLKWFETELFLTDSIFKVKCKYPNESVSVTVSHRCESVTI